MRYKFAHEGIDTVLDRKIEVGALRWDVSRPLPVNSSNNFADEGSIIGLASEIQREDDGTLTAEVEWNENADDVKDKVNKKNGVYLTIYASEVEDVEGTTPNRHVKSAMLRALFLTNTNEDPWAEKV